ncbi:MAG: hypothetical protein A3F43_00295 [Gammaproteobacteria bacterium RIFCSPHIGHO2_12_FULL_42_10]|nr:MAG: hypothetical protein A3F43_00295 [Gammaproteobacteria bacterium RIFCSPHIGHO2_12_FULL_42_10]
MFQRHSAQGSYLKYQQHHPEGVNHYRSTAIDLNGVLDITLLQQAFDALIKRHDMMRNSLTEENNQPRFKTADYKNNDNPIQTLDASHLAQKPLAQFKDTLSELQAEDFLNKPFDMVNGPLWRALLIKNSNNQYQFVILTHPMIADDKSIQIMLSEIETHYNLALDKQNIVLPQIDDTKLTGTKADEFLRHNYWRTKLEDLNIIKLHTPQSYHDAFTFNGKHKPLHIDSKLVAALKAKMPNFSLEQILQASVYTLLHRYTDDTDITIGATDANRATNNNQVDYFANWLTLRLPFEKDAKFIDLLRKTADTQKVAVAKQLPIDEIYQSVLPDYTTSALRTMSPFDILVTVNEEAPHLNLKNVTASPPTQLDLGYTGFSYYELKLNHLADGSCDGFINFNTDLFDDEYIDNLQGHLQNILNTIAKNPDSRISEIPILLDSEIKLQKDFNNTFAEPHFGKKLAPEIFSEIAKEALDKPALVFHPMNGEPERMNYGELENYTNQIANYLRNECHLKTGDHVAISVTRSLNLPAMIIGAMKAGLVFVPLETSPGKLLDHKLEAAHAALVITDQKTTSLFQNKNILNIDDPNISADIKGYDKTFYKPDLTPGSPAYEDSSSGTTTGIPKTSLLGHAGLANLLNYLYSRNYPEGSKVLCTSLPTFDAFNFDQFVAWVTHGCVHLSSDEERYSPITVERICRQEKINFAVFLRDLMSILPSDLPLDVVISIGAAPSPGVFAAWLAANKFRKIINGLGHTETGICLSLQEYHEGDDPELSGAPIDNMQTFILNKNLQICPIGVPGEQYVAGPGLALEYVDNQDLTDSKFVYMQFDPILQKFNPCLPMDPGAIRLYATGDIACYQKTREGKLSTKLLGRKDRIKKIIGNVVDLDGVESLISSHPGVENITVIPNKDSSSLIAFVIRKSEFKNFPIEDAKAHLRTYIKDTLLPVAAYPQFVFMKEFKLTPNGKINYRELPLPPTPDHPLLNKIKKDPLTKAELTATLTSMWKDVLGCYKTDTLPTDIEFKYLGGNSIAMGKLEKIINRDLPLPPENPVSIGNKRLSPKMTIDELTDTIFPLQKKTNSQFRQTPNHFNKPFVTLFKRSEKPKVGDDKSNLKKSDTVKHYQHSK